MTPTNTRSTATIGDDTAARSGETSPGPMPEIPTFDTIDAKKQYFRDDEETSPGATAPTDDPSPGPMPEIPTFDTIDAKKQY